MASGLVAFLAIAFALASAPWSRVMSNERSHVWWGAVLVVSAAWLLRPVLAGDLHLHFLGATVLVLMFGARLAFIGIAVAAIDAVLVGVLPPEALGQELLTAGLFPILASRAGSFVSQRYLPKNAFVYIFVSAFAVAWLATFAAEYVGVLLTSPATRAQQEDGVLAIVAVLIAFAEATLTGMLVAIMVAYRPQWLESFDETAYFRRPAA